MHDGSSHSDTELFVTSDSAGHEDSDTAGRFAGLHLSEQIGSNRNSEVVIILFLSQTACHSTTFDRRRHDVESDSLEHVDGLRCCV